MNWEIIFAIIPGIILFLYGTEQFSSEIQNIAGKRFSSFLGKATKTPLRGTLLGALVTAAIQSSLATTIIAMGLVNAGVISFAQSLGVIFGANIGTTVTAQLVAFKVTAFAPIFILLGFVLGLTNNHFRAFSKPIFYFGLLFFALNLVSNEVEFIKDDPLVVSIFSNFSNILVALAAGFVLTNLFQSSSVTSGLVVVFAQGGLITLPQAVPVLFGANIGTTVTSLLVSARKGLFVRRAAVAHFLFNFLGVLMFLPILPIFISAVQSLGGNEAQQVANAHVIFNVAAAAVFLVLIGPFKSAVEWIVRGKEDEILLATKFLGERLPEKNSEAFLVLERELNHSLETSRMLFDEVLSAIKAGGQKFDRASKLESLADFLDGRISEAILELSRRDFAKKDVERMVLLVRLSNANEQLSDLADDISQLYQGMSSKGISFSAESIGGLSDVYSDIQKNIIEFEGGFPHMGEKAILKMSKNDSELRQKINANYDSFLKRMAKKQVPSGSFFIEMLSVVEAANAKLREMRKLAEMYCEVSG